jgi:Cu2+-exporting ATPase
VLAQADVSFAVSHGGSTRVAQVLAHADVVLLSPRLSDVLASRRIACKAMGIARQNLAWAGAYNLVCIPLALA